MFFLVSFGIKPGCFSSLGYEKATFPTTPRPRSFAMSCPCDDSEDDAKSESVRSETASETSSGESGDDTLLCLSFFFFFFF